MLKEAALKTPDPQRAIKNLGRLKLEHPQFVETHHRDIAQIARLFSFSQFLADYSIGNPSILSWALRNLDHVAKKNEIVLNGRKELESSVGKSPDILRREAMRLLRDIKKTHLLKITLRDISGIASLDECMFELSCLSEAIIQLAVDVTSRIMKEKFGDIKGGSFSVIGLGKLGASELNYSSDVDVMSVYQEGGSLSSGILTSSGVRTNRISSHEYFCRLTEIIVALLQTATENGIAYRVDLRLRPNGQKGAISLPLNSYLSYYEAWGKTWERMALVRARPVAGDEALGKSFMDGIEPFVWRRSIDYHDIEEIRELKKKIDTIFDVNDIKRGYGGIREIEFFVQTFQLIYGGGIKNLRASRITDAIGKLNREGFLSDEEARVLTENYYFLRRLEHVLQMKDDVQTHSLPAQPDEVAILGRKMLFDTQTKFVTELRLRRLKVKDMYNSLLGAPDVMQEDLLSLKESLPDDALMDYLSFKGFSNPELALRDINILLEHMSLGKTMKERNLLRKTIPLFLEQIVESANKDRALTMFTSFTEKIAMHESYIDLLHQRNDTREIIVKTLSVSCYLTKSLLRTENLEGIFEYPDIRIDYKSLRSKLIRMLSQNADPMKALRDFKINEELKSGFLFLNRSTNVYGFMNTLSMLADVIVRAITEYLKAGRDFAVVGLGGFGARELNIGSDIDIIFIRRDAGQNAQLRANLQREIAEEIIRFLSEYTKDGILYKVDMRLRPDGSKGVLVNDVEGYRKYYMKSAQPWEIQALLRSRPVAGDPTLMKAFQEIKRQAISKRRGEISGSYIRDMRRRSIREISKESHGYDIKAGPGGIKEIEFLVEYLQLKYCARFIDLVTPNTVNAIKRLSGHGIIDREDENVLLRSHEFLRNLDTLLRLNEEEVLKTDSEIIDIIIGFLNLNSRDELIRGVEEARREVVEIARRFL
ncbi:MAG: bifunctional [glutamate--ammonia ligase]-adenylyl-L-tyrosine phosphorylase/[glutamate--ammonia-ligase] adenylyltransferase [Nitrospirota bacterium]